MTFGPDHYVPVLKVKRGEKKALQALSPHVQERITPLLEVVERKPDKAPTIEGHIKTAFKDFGPAVAPFPRYFLDCREIASDGAAAADEVFDRASALGVPFTPVTGITRTVDVIPAMKHAANGIAIRLTRAEFEAGVIPHGLPAFLKASKLVPGDIDLIVDLGAVDQMIVPGIVGLTAAFLADVPHHGHWRTLTVSGCAFPSSMAGVGRNDNARVERSEWLAWRDDLHAVRATLLRLPTFSDCAIQHPDGVEGFDPKTMQVSASVRYALSEAWLLIKGESTRVTLASDQFPALGAQLAGGPLAHEFAGAAHCVGCQGIQAAAGGAPKFGSAETWRRLGTIHHITRAVEDLAALAWP